MDERDCFTCPNCFQYNGFTADGDYNRTIPQMYDASLNPPVRHSSYSTAENRHPLCPKCRHEQTLLIQKIAAFEPTSEKAFDKELESYRAELEKLHALCDQCQSAVQIKLNEVSWCYNLVISSCFHMIHAVTDVLFKVHQDLKLQWVAQRLNVSKEERITRKPKVNSA